MKAKNFDDKFDQGNTDIIDDLDLSTARRVNQEQKRINIGLSKGERAILEGRTTSHDKAKVRMQKWLK